MASEEAKMLLEGPGGPTPTPSQSNLDSVSHDGKDENTGPKYLKIKGANMDTIHTLPKSSHRFLFADPLFEKYYREGKTTACPEKATQDVASRTIDILDPYFETETVPCLCCIGVLTLGIWPCCKYTLVDDGYVATTQNDGAPELLGPGHHFLLSPLNINPEHHRITKPHIQRLTLHIITVKSHQFGVGYNQGEPVILGPGVHVIKDAYFRYRGPIAMNSPYQSIENVHWVIIREGQRGLAWEGHTPLVLPSGMYHIESTLFRFDGCYDIDRDNVVMGPFNVVTVDEGRVGICYDKGVLRVLQPGEHWLNQESNQRFLDFVPTTQQVRKLTPLELLTNDGLMVLVKGSITFRVVDPHKAISNIGCDLEEDAKSKLYRSRRGQQKDSRNRRAEKKTHSQRRMGGEHADQAHERYMTNAIFETITRRANDTLASLLGGMEILNTAGMGFASSTIAHDEVGPDTLGMEAKQTLQERESEHRELNNVISHRFKESLTITLEHEWGVKLGDMNVVDIKVLDKDVRKALADGVRANIAAVTERRAADSEAETLRILAQGDRDASNITTDGDAYATEETAKAQKEAGDLLEQSEVAVEIRLAETAALALSSSGSSMMITDDASAPALMQAIGVKSRRG